MLSCGQRKITRNFSNKGLLFSSDYNVSIISFSSQESCIFWELITVQN